MHYWDLPTEWTERGEITARLATDWELRPQRPPPKSKTGKKQEKRKQSKTIEEEKEDEEGVPIAQGIVVQEDDGGAQLHRYHDHSLCYHSLVM